MGWTEACGKGVKKKIEVTTEQDYWKEIQHCKLSFSIGTIGRFPGNYSTSMLRFYAVGASMVLLPDQS